MRSELSKEEFRDRGDRTAKTGVPLGRSIYYFPLDSLAGTQT